jgi:choline kinase
MTRARTHAVILAAGFGSRLGDRTRLRPKCLVEVLGRPILERTLEALIDRGIDDVTIVVGHLQEQIREFCAPWQGRLRLTFAENSDVGGSGTARSLALGLAALGDAVDDVLVIEADVVFDAAALDLLFDTPGSSTLVASFEPAITGSAVHVEADGDIRAWVHGSAVQPGDLGPRSFKTVNLTRVRGAQAVSALRAGLQHVLDGKPRSSLEDGFGHLIRTRALPVRAVHIGTHRWFEVDTEEDLREAEARFGGAAVAASGGGG